MYIYNLIVKTRLMKKTTLLLCLVMFCMLLSTLNVCAQQYSIYEKIDVINKDICLDVRDFDNKTIYGNAAITLRSKVKKLDTIPLLLQSFQIDSVLVNGKVVNNYLYNDTLLSIPLKQKLKKGKETTVRVVYHGQPTGGMFGGFVFSETQKIAYNMGSLFKGVPHSYGRSWFPAVDDNRSRSTFDLRIRVADPMKGVGSGILVDTTPHDDGSTTWHWRVNQSAPDYLVSVAVGNYEKIHMDYQQTSRTLPIDIYVMTDEVEEGHNAYKNIHEILRIFESYYGEYAFDRVGFVSTTSGGSAMEHIGNIAMPRIKETYPVSYFQLIVHELAHAWFGNQVTCATEGDMWLNEGFATFSPGLIFQKFYPGMVHNYYRQCQMSALMAHQFEGGYRALENMSLDYTFALSNYYKGAMVVQTLKTQLGDEEFFSLLRKYLEKFRFSHASTTDFRQFMQANTHTDLSSFFDLMVSSPGFITFEVDSIRGTLHSGTYNGTLYLEQKQLAAPTYGANMRVPVTFYDADNTRSEKVYVTAFGRFSQCPVSLPFEPAYGIVDKDYELCKASFCDRIEINNKGVFNLPFNPVTLTCTSFTSTDSVNVECYQVPPDVPAGPWPVKFSLPFYWRITGVNPLAHQLDGSFTINKGDANTAKVLDGDKPVYMMYRQDPSHDWAKLVELTRDMRVTGKVDVKSLESGEYCLGVESDQCSINYN